MKAVCTICLAAIVAIIFTSCSHEHESYFEGQRQAERDLTKGEFNIAVVDDTNMPIFLEYTDLLRKRYGIGYCSYSLPANPPAAGAWVRGYNDMALPKIEQKFGAQILKQTMSDAEKLHNVVITKP